MLCENKKCLKDHSGAFSKRFCSRSCANSRNWSEEDKIKKSTIAKNSTKASLAQRNKFEKFLLKKNKLNYDDFLEQLAVAIENKNSYQEISKQFNIHHSTIPKIIKRLGLTYKGQQNWRKGKTFYSEPRITLKRPRTEMFSENSTVSGSYLRNTIIKEKLLIYECAICKTSKWQDKFINLELDHINGNNRNNLLTNLRWLCPNCHSQTETFRGKNIDRQRSLTTEAQILEKLQEGLNIRQTLLSLNLAAKGGNYNRVKSIGVKYGLIAA